MTFEKWLAARAADIEVALARALDAAASVEAGVPARLAAAMNHAAMGGGKRMRPVLLIETAAVFGAAADKAMPAAVALELVHCYSLVHDDLPAMDNDALRRGKPTVWKAFDEWTAILAGDALLTLAFEHLAAAGEVGLPHALRLQLVSGLAAAAGANGMVGGQCLDLEADKLGHPTRPDVAHIQRLQAMKTGRLFELACRAGALIGGASALELATLSRFGAGLGAAFQLADDILDVEGDEATLGKATAKDAAAGKATLVGLQGLEAARALLAEIEQASRSEIAGLGPRADRLRETLQFVCARRN